MDGTAAGTSTGRADGSAAEGASGTGQPAGRADATAPLPVTAPADATGPLPAPQPGVWFTPGDPTAAQPAVAAPPTPEATSTAPPAWFATGPLPVLPSAELFGPAPPRPDAAAATPPAGLFEPTGAAPTNGTPPPAGAPGPQPTTEVPTPASPAAPTPPADAFPATGPQPTHPAPPADLFTPTGQQPTPPTVPSAPADLFTPAGPQPPAPAAPAPPTGLAPAADAQPGIPTPPAVTAAPAGPFPAPAPPTVAPPPADLFTPAGPQPAAPADPHAGHGPQPVAAHPADTAPQADLFAATAPQPATPAPPTGHAPPGAPPVVASPPPAAAASPADPGTATGPHPPSPTDPAPPTGLFAAAVPRPDLRAAPETAGAPPVRHVDATGPMPAIAVADVQAPAGVAEDAAPAPAQGGVEASPRTGAWAFDPDPSEPPRTDAWSSAPDDRRGREVQSWPLPTSGGRAHATSTTTPAAAPPARVGKAAKRPAWPLTLVGVLVAVAAGIALVYSLARTAPADLAATAATEAAGWPGAHYTGVIPADDGGQIRFDLTVTADGASGTLTRDGGRASAELLADAGGTLLRANKEWWLYHHPARADDLAGSWVADPLTEVREIGPVLQLHPAALAEHVRGPQPAQWKAIEQQLLDGRPGVVLSDGARRVVVGSDDPHPLLAVDVVEGASTAPVQVGRPADDQVAAVTGAAARVRQEAAPRTLTQLLLERPKVEIQLQPEPLCTAQTCNVTVVVTNTGTAPARGRLEVSADGKVVADHPLDVHPGQVATFTATAPNPQFAQPGATGRILWESRAVDD